MKTITLTKQPFTIKKGDVCPTITPNVNESCILADPDGTHVGLFLKELPADLQNLVNIADQQLRSDNVKKSRMDRKTLVGYNPDGTGKYEVISQWSTILGSCPPKPHMRRPYPSRSQVHQQASARPFTKAMNAIGLMAFGLVQQYTPAVAQEHTIAIQKRLPTKWRFGGPFSSTISNCNISAPIHQDNANIKGAINLIITKRRNSTGGNLHVPDYNATFDMNDNSMLVYPAWRNLHGVTPIIPTHQGGYRNSHVWYALDSFANHG